MAMELILLPAQVEITRGIRNKEELKIELASRLEYYRGLVVTEDGMKDAKTDRAALNKLRTAIDDERKKVKKQFADLCAPFEADCKELIAMIDEPIGAIDCQMDALNEKRKAEKRAELERVFKMLEPPAFVKIDDVLDPKWGNATAKIDKLKADLAENIQRIADDLADIRGLYADSPMLPAITERFEKTLDKGAALAYAAEIERKAEQERQKAEQERKDTSAEPTAANIPETNQPEPAHVVESEAIGKVTFTVTGTKAQIVAVRDFMKKNGISFEVIR